MKNDIDSFHFLDEIGWLLIDSPRLLPSSFPSDPLPSIESSPDSVVIELMEERKDGKRGIFRRLEESADPWKLGDLGFARSQLR
jgi:hypothetical protein